MGTKSAWTPERRARQRAIIARTKPWEKSTGPKTAEGKARSSQNRRLPPALAEAELMRKEIMSRARAVYGRQRRLKTKSAKRER